ncbi:hypothetical protein [Calidifontibacillus oryziterrae]|uniref:hypothetical protein n=1 Tax=Calidifontibacillus oryziterrae TaxID=1191699 RepID=UPI0003098D40|nr:hypothetical protein [Calidifontibacillus oryziterrae]
MSLEWYDRISSELQDHLESICEKYDQVGHMTIDRGAKHPRIEFFVETDDNGRDYFCTLFFDPHNEEFYIETLDFDLELKARTILTDIEEIVDVVHESLHDYLNEDEEIELYELDDDLNDEEVGIYEIDDNEDYEEIDVYWTTDEVTAYTYKDEVEVAYQFGVIEDTGDGVLRRVNRIVTTDNELIEDETNFIFSKEEASTIISMIASNMDSLKDFNESDHID